MAQEKGYAVKNVKTFQGMEGEGFTASLYLDGKRIGLVRDSAYGGMYEYELTRDDYNALDAHAREVWNPDDHKIIVSGKEKALDYYGPDSFIGVLVDAYLNLRDIKRWCRTMIVCVMPSNEEGEFTTFKAKYSKDMAERIRKRYPDVVEIVNERFAS